MVRKIWRDIPIFSTESTQKTHKTQQCCCVTWCQRHVGRCPFARRRTCRDPQDLVPVNWHHGLIPYISRLYNLQLYIYMISIGTLFGCTGTISHQNQELLGNKRLTQAVTGLKGGPTMSTESHVLKMSSNQLKILSATSPRPATLYIALNWFSNIHAGVGSGPARASGPRKPNETSAFGLASLSRALKNLRPCRE